MPGGSSTLKRSFLVKMVSTENGSRRLGCGLPNGSSNVRTEADDLVSRLQETRQPVNFMAGMKV